MSNALGRIAVAAFGFRCTKCAAPLDGGSADGTPPYCVECCPQHDFRFDKYDGHRCAHCYASPEPDWYDSDCPATPQAAGGSEGEGQ